MTVIIVLFLFSFGSLVFQHFQSNTGLDRAEYFFSPRAAPVYKMAYQQLSYPAPTAYGFLFHFFLARRYLRGSFKIIR